jgi:hypothetical protein
MRGARPRRRAGPACSCGRRPGPAPAGAGKARARLDQREQAARGHIQPAEGAAQQADGFAHQPVVAGGPAAWRPWPAPRRRRPSVLISQVPMSSSLVRMCRMASSSSRAICQRVPGGAGGLDAGDVGRLGAGGALTVKVAVRLARSISTVTWLDSAARRRRSVRSSGVSATPLASAGRSLGGQCAGALLHLGGKLRRLGDVVDQAPVLGLLAAHAFDAGAEDVGQVVAHMALVGHAGQAAGAGQHAQQRHFGQADGAGAVVHQDDLVAGQGQLVAAAGAGAVDGGQELQAAVLDESSRPLRVSLVNLQKFTFQAWLDTPSMKMLAPEQNTGPWRW